MSEIPRRVVTGHKDGISTIIQNSLVDHVITHETGFIIFDPWATDSMPVNLDRCATLENSLWAKIHHNGSLFRYIHIPPDTAIKQHFALKPRGITCTDA